MGKKIMKFFKHLFKIEYKSVTEISLIVLILAVSIITGNLLGSMLKIPSFILIMFFAFVFFVISRHLSEKIRKLEILFAELDNIKYLGEFILLVVVSYILIVLIFALVYYFTALYAGINARLYRWIYFSIITLTTVGFGDVTPINDFMKLVAALEGFVGYISAPIFISIGLSLIFSNKEKK